MAAVMATAQKIARAQMKAFAADGITVQHFCEGAGGQVVFHTHVHVLPRHEGVALRPPGQMADQDVLEAHAEKIRAALGR
jgi:histidine triad (HIT) family protein